MLTLGISDGHDASVTLADSGKVIFAASEERFSRRKMQQGFPYNALGHACGLIKGRRLDKVFVCTKFGKAIPRFFNSAYSKAPAQKNILLFPSKLYAWAENRIALFPLIRDIESSAGLWAISRRLKDLGLNFCSIEAVDHHEAHMLTAVSLIRSDRFIAVSMDAYGDGRSGFVVSGESGLITSLGELSYRDSLAHLYGWICQAMGFKESEEGKVMALACHGKPGPLCGIFESLFKISHRRLKISNVYRKRAFLKMVKSFSREDAAYALQKAVEEAAVRYVSSFVPERGIPDLFLAGGFFANIKVTQRLIESGLFSRVFVFPNMGDGGTSFFGNGYRDMYLGPEFAEDEIRSLLESSKIPYADEPQVEEKIAVLLSQGKVVARFNGRMEFGPRALGNRSILYRADDPSANNWLNKRLKRDEFMPFSPATLSEFKEKCYLNINTGEFAARFMTASFNCTEFMRKSSPGAVHIDGTARPQIVSLEDNPGYYKVLRKYYEITGKPSIINTSFNMHNEPIVCSPKEAIATFREARLDYLAMGRFLIKGG